MTFGLFIAAVLAGTAIVVVASGFVGNRIAALRPLPLVARMVVVLSGLVLTAAVAALAIGSPDRNDECNSSTPDDIAAVIAVVAVPAIVVSACVGLGTLLVSRRSSKAAGLALAASIAAGVCDWFALTHSLHICLE